VTTVVHGHSDDLIEVEGDISEEFTVFAGDQDNFLGFDNGVILRVVYTDQGVWRITPVAGADKVIVAHAPEGDESDYSDVAVLAGDVAWVVHGTEYGTRS
jgi:hypothetical protein